MVTENTQTKRGSDGDVTVKLSIGSSSSTEFALPYISFLHHTTRFLFAANSSFSSPSLFEFTVVHSSSNTIHSTRITIGVKKRGNETDLAPFLCVD